MTEGPMFNLVDLVASDYDATLDFYRQLGVAVHDGSPGDIRHAHLEFGELEIHIDNEHLAAVQLILAHSRAIACRDRVQSCDSRGGR
jgi:hypothetical protein